MYCILPVKTHAFIFHVSYVIIFYVIFTCLNTNLIPSGIFCFFNERDKQVLGLFLIMESNVRYVASLTCIERFLNRSDELHLLGHGIKAMTPKSCYNISFVETASEKS